MATRKKSVRSKIVQPKPIVWLNGDITVNERINDFHAYLTNYSRIWDVGRTEAEAVGNLIRSHPTYFKVRLETIKFLDLKTK